MPTFKKEVSKTLSAHFCIPVIMKAPVCSHSGGRCQYVSHPLLGPGTHHVGSSYAMLLPSFLHEVS